MRDAVTASGEWRRVEVVAVDEELVVICEQLGGHCAIVALCSDSEQWQCNSASDSRAGETVVCLQLSFLELIVVESSCYPMLKSPSRVIEADFRAVEDLVCYILAQKCLIRQTRERAKGQMGGKTGEWGEGPAGATVPYDVRGLHAARGANWTAPRGDIR